MIQLGPFSLERTLGRGGMGVVWRARHVEKGFGVAVKVLTGQATQDPFFLSTFRNEARAAAALDHPNVAAVYDYGQIPPETERASEGLLRAGSPYLVMELAEGGSLEPHLGRLPWRAVRVLLLRLLDALAHAHARGVVHRDLKPGNALLAGGWARVKLTDFGLAHPYASDAGVRDEEGAVGTPAYMAPEQFEGAWRDYGPWTDLYGLGCLAFALVGGEPPFGRRPPTQRAMTAHLLLPAPELVPRCEVPQGFEDWVRTLLEKEPSRRFLRAADAAWALERLGPADEAAPRPARGRRGQVPDDTVPLEREAMDTVPLPQRPSPSAFDAPEPLHVEPVDARAPDEARPALPPMPATWRPSAERPPVAASALKGAGLGLMGLRAIELVGREPERDLLWETLARVRRMGRARMVLLLGPTGTGKSRLCEWLCERAHEVGAASIFKAELWPDPARGDALSQMLARALHTGGLPRAAAARRVARALDRPEEGAPEVGALLDLVAPLEPGAGRLEDRHGVVRRFLERASRERPAIVWLEDAHWSRDALDFALRALEAQAWSPGPMLLLATVREDALPERPEEAAAVRELLARPDVRCLSVGPLPAEASMALLRDRLGLEAGLAAVVEARAAGNPRFIVELVSEQAQRGLLVYGEHGYRLSAGSSIDLPDDLYAVWAARARRLLEGRPEGDAIALELAAVLGLDVDGEEWTEATARAGLEPPWDLVETLLAWRLARCEPTGPWSGWTFANSLFRETLVRRAREAARWEGHHRVAAALVGERAAQKGAGGAAERLGRHLAEAGALEEALGPLLTAAEERYAAGELHRCAALLEERDRAIARLGLKEDDPRTCAGWVLWSRTALEQGKGDLAAAWAARADEAATRNGWPELRARALWSCARIASRLGDSNAAVTLLEDAKRHALASGNPRLLAGCRRAQAGILLGLGLLDEAARGFAEAAAELEGLGELREAARCWLGLGRVSAKAGSHEVALAHAARARATFQATGLRSREAECLVLSGDVAWQAGDADGAEAAWGEALSLHQAHQARLAMTIRARMALAEIARGRYAEARRVLLAALAALERRGRAGHFSAIHVWLLPCCAAEGDWQSFDHHLAISVVELQETGLVEVDVARMSALAGELAYAGGQMARARMAWSLALEQWLLLGWTREIRALKRYLGEEGAEAYASGGGP